MADQLAVRVNEDRPAAFRQLQLNARQHFALWTDRIRRLRVFYFKVSDTKVQAEVVDLTLGESFD